MVAGLPYQLRAYVMTIHISLFTSSSTHQDHTVSLETYHEIRLIHSDEGLTLETSVFESLRWLIYLIDPVVDNLF